MGCERRGSKVESGREEVEEIDWGRIGRDKVGWARKKIITGKSEEGRREEGKKKRERRREKERGKLEVSASGRGKTGVNETRPKGLERSLDT